MNVDRPGPSVVRIGPRGSAALESSLECFERRPRPDRSRSRLRFLATIVRVLLAAGALGAPSWAESGKEDAAGGSAGAAKERAADTAAPGEGTLLGQVFDAASGIPIEGARVVLVWPAPADGSQARQEVRETGKAGAYRFPSLPPGRYTLRFSKSGYRSSSILDLEVRPGQLNRADSDLAPLVARTTDEAPDIEEFVVLGTEVAVDARELRLDADELLNVLSAEELSNFAATDVAEGIKRLAGVNVVEGQFAVIRGLEDRYSSTLYNGAPIPSPDPDRQSVQLDLFPAEVVSQLVVAKTFGPALPSNSSGGSIDVVTHDYPPEELVFQLSGGLGLNTKAWERFLDYQGQSPVGEEADGSDTTEGEGGAYLGGRRELAGREVRFKALYNWQLDYATGEGTQEGLEPRRHWRPGEPQPPFVRSFQSGDLSLGELNISDGEYDLTTSGQEEQQTRYGGLGFDLDEEGSHKIDASLFHTRKTEEVVQLKENGFLPNFDYGALAEREAGSGEINARTDYLDFSTLGAFVGRGGVRDNRAESASRGALWFTNFSERQSFRRARDLSVYQINGDHQIDALEGLHLGWGANHAETTQDESSYGAQIFFEPDDPMQATPSFFPVAVDVLGPGLFAANPEILVSKNEIEEKQDFVRLDADYEIEVSGATLTLSTGGWYEQADRDVSSSFLESPTVDTNRCQAAFPLCDGSLAQFAIFGDTPQQVGETLFDFLTQDEDGLLGRRDTVNNSSREIEAWHLGLKGTVLEDRLDLLAGFRLENILIESNNDAFIGEDRFGAPEIFPTRYLFFDRADNPSREETSEANVLEVLRRGPETFNDQILGIDVPVDVPCPVAGQPERRCVDLLDQAQIESFVNGKIDERELLPSLGFTHRPIPGLQLRGAYSETVARPSFREMGFYVSVEPGTDDLVVGNPQLQLSHVESYDARAEYTWGELGDLAALSLFYKTIEDPIESIVVRNPLNAEVSSSAVFRAFFNNPNEATLWGIEVEARKSFDFLGIEVAEYFSVGGNYTYIDAEVDRTEAELLRTPAFFGTLAGDRERFSELEKSRRLFGQPEWIANADLSFDHPDWGTKATLAFFAISDVLDAAGVANAGPDGQIISFTLDRYVDSFYQLDLILSQTFQLDRLPRGWSLPGDLTFKLSAKNLTDTPRALIYDLEQTDDEFDERSYKVGRDYKLSVTYSFAF